MNVATFFTNRIAVTYLVTALLAAVAAFHVVLPPSVSVGNVTAALMLIAAAVSAALRFGHPGEPGADAKVWWKSKTIIAQIVASLFALVSLAGLSPAIEQAQVVDAVLGVVTIASMAFGSTITKPIATSLQVARSPAAAAVAALCLALLLAACGMPKVSSASSVVATAHDVAGGADIAYIGASKVGLQLVASGQLKEDMRLALDERAYQALLAVRQVAAAVVAGTAGTNDLEKAQAAFLAAIAAINGLQKEGAL